MIMACGHSPNSKTETGDPACAICDETEVAVINGFSLDGRKARCACGKTTDSGTFLAFFEYRGPESTWATERCGAPKCGYFKRVHQPIHPMTGRPGITDHEFTERGPDEFDSYYCGHAGWD